MTFTAGQKVRASELNAVFRGVIARASRTSASAGTTATSGATAQGVVRLSASLVKGRLYRVSVPNLGVYSSGDGDRVGMQLTYTTDGSTPSVSSSVLVFGQYQVSGVDNVNVTGIEGFHVPTADETFTVLLSIWRQAGSGTVHAYGAGDWPCSLLIEDLGVDPGATGTNI